VGWVRKGERVKGKGDKVWDFRKRLQQMEFKFEFELQQPKIMHQHECHK
jgi:hypothetical protein